jgi:predicted acyltransferase
LAADQQETLDRLFRTFHGGAGFIAFAAFVWVIDELKIRRGIQPLVVFGKNAITVYLCGELFSTKLETVRVGNSTAHSWIFQHIFAGMGSPENTSLYFALTFVGAMYLVAYTLHRRGLFLRV